MHNVPISDDYAGEQHAPRETQTAEIPCALSSRNKVVLHSEADSSLVTVRISTTDYNVAAQIERAALLLAVRAICESTIPPSLKHTARLQRVLDDIAVERARQEALVDAKQLPFTCADRNVSLVMKTPVISEEVFEVFTAAAAQRVMMIVQDFGASSFATERDEIKKSLRTELIQLAAVAAAWAESLTPDLSPEK